MEYVISDYGTFGYDYVVDELYISTSGLNIDLLSDDELILFVSDCIVHELLHKIIYNNICLEYNKDVAYIVSALFECIERNFLRYPELDDRVTDTNDTCTWKQAIEKDGIDILFKLYNLDMDMYFKHLDKLLGMKRGIGK